MRVLMLTPQIPYPPRQGTALRNWGLLQGVAAKHQVSLLSFVAPDQSADPPPAPLASLVESLALIPQPARSLKDRLWDVVTSPLPDLALRLQSSSFRERLAAWLADRTFDWVFVEGLEMTPYLDVLGDVDRPPRIVLDEHNCEYLLQQRAFTSDLKHPRRWLGAAYSFLQWQRLRRYEARVCRQANLVVAVSDADAGSIRALVPEVEPLVIPNGIAVSDHAASGEQTSLEQPAFVFTGTMDFRPNVDGALWFVHEVWPRIRAVLPNAHFYVVGKRPHRRLDPLRTVPGVVLTGAVADTRPYIHAAAVYVVPLWVGGGTRFKILEAAAMGKAIVSTTLGAEGFSDVSRAVMLADDAGAFADACVRLVHDPALSSEFSMRARTFVAAYDWQVLLPRLLARLDEGEGAAA